jgi:hypothetical protein
MTMLITTLAAQEKRARTAQKSPWEWTTEERLKDRFDPAKIRERQLAYEARFPRAAAAPRGAREESVGTSGRQPVVYMIDGSRNPELFLRYELFDGLLTGLDPNETGRLRQRAYLQESIRQLGYDDAAFWTSLESIAAKYLPLRFGSTSHLPPTELNAALEARCRERYDALAAARALFGSRQFDLVLYAVMAPVTQYSEATLDEHRSDEHRRAEAGCR